MGEEDNDKKDCIFDNNFMCFLSGRDTLRCSRCQRNLTYFTVRAKSWPFFSMGCHGMLRGCMMSKKDARSNLNIGKELALGTYECVGTRKMTRSSTHLKTCSMPPK